MAKGYALGTWKGKKGSSVFYKIWNTNNKVRQGIREYQPQVSNPQSDGQALQRMKMQPQANIARVLREIISRSFEGVKYGATSRLLFRKLAMNLNEGYPYLAKGDQRPCPGSYQISRGSLSPILSTFDSDGDFVYFSDLKVAQPNQEIPDTYGDCCRNMLSFNPSLKEGDQLTFVYCVIDDITNPQPFIWKYGSIIIDTTITESWTDYVQEQRLNDLEEFNSGMVAFVDKSVYAVACICSRLDSTGQNYLRSTAVLNVYEPALEDFFSTATRTMARRSYQKATSRDVDWPVEQVDTLNVVPFAYTIESVSGTDYISLVGTKCLVGINADSEEIVLVYTTLFQGEPGNLVGENGQPLTRTVGQDIYGVPVSAVPAFNGLPTRVYSA